MSLFEDLTDPRQTPANSRIAAAHLQGRVQAEDFTAGEPASIAQPVADLAPASGRGGRDRQLLLGAEVTVYERREGSAFVRAARDGFCGYVDAAALGPAATPTHQVCTRATHLYVEPDMKRGEHASLPFGARLAVTGETPRFWETPLGFVPRPHLRPLDQRFTDPVAVARLFLGTPYLWGGNSGFGIDCSGLVQTAMIACGIDCPGDSDQQERLLGRALPEGTPCAPGDLLFWKGHVAMAVDSAVMIHANAHAMAVTLEPIAEAIARIAAQGDGPVTAHRRALPDPA